MKLFSHWSQSWNMSDDDDDDDDDNSDNNNV
jgi:hypothetical protein